MSFTDCAQRFIKYLGCAQRFKCYLQAEAKDLETI